MSSSDDSVPELSKKPAKTFGRPMGGIALFGANPGLMNEMKNRLKKTRDSEEGSEPASIDHPTPITPDTSSTPTNTTPKVPELEKSARSETECAASVKVSSSESDQCLPSSRKSSTKDETLLKEDPTLPSPSGQSKLDKPQISIQCVDDTSVVLRSHDIQRAGDNRLSHLNELRARRPRTRPPTAYRCTTLAGTCASSPNGPCQDPPVSSSTSGGQVKTGESGDSQLDKFFGGCNIDG